MKLTLTQSKPWFSGTYPKWMCILRMALGLFITYKGLHYMFSIGNFQALPYEGMDPMVDLMLFHVVTFIHLVGGVFITLGFKTRVMVLPQLFIVLGAMFLINSPSRLIVWNNTTELIISSVVVVLLFVYLIFGSGRFSIDAMSKKSD